MKKIAILFLKKLFSIISLSFFLFAIISISDDFLKFLSASLLLNMCIFIHEPLVKNEFIINNKNEINHFMLFFSSIYSSVLFLIPVSLTFYILSPLIGLIFDVSDNFPEDFNGGLFYIITNSFFISLAIVKQKSIENKKS